MLRSPLRGRGTHAAHTKKPDQPLLVRFFNPEVPPAGFEPAHPAPEADALSPELRGRIAVLLCDG